MVLQEDSETGEPFGVKDFDTKEEAQRVADDMQRGIDNAWFSQIFNHAQMFFKLFRSGNQIPLLNRLSDYRHKNFANAVSEQAESPH